MQENDIKITIKTLVNLGQLDALKSIRDSLLKDVEMINQALGEAPKTPENLTVNQGNIGEIEFSNYDADWSLSEKFLYILKKTQRFIKFRDAARTIITLEGFGDENELNSKLTNGTRKIKEEGIIAKFQDGSSATNTYWGSSKWLNDDGTIKPKYMFIKPQSEIKKVKDNDLFSL